MKIACFQNLHASGARRALYHFSRGLKERGHTIDFYSLKDTAGGQFSLTEIAHQSFINYDSLSYSSPKFSLGPYFLKVHLRYLKKKQFFEEFSNVYKKMAADIDQKRYDLVFAHNCLQTQAPFLLRHLKTKSVYYAHEPLRKVHDKFAVEPDNISKKENRRFIKNIKATLWQKGLQRIDDLDYENDAINIQKADHVFTNSYFTNECVFKAYGVMSTVVHPGVETDYFKPLNIPKQNIVLSVGGLIPFKKHDFVIDSLAQLDPASRPKLIIIGIWGADKYDEYLINYAKQKGVDCEVKCGISDDQLLKYYNQALALVFVPLMEPLGLVPLEAMSCQTPVIGVKEGGLRETIIDGQTGILVNRKVESCAEAIQTLINQPKLSKKLGKQARIHVCKNWDWNVCIDQLEKSLKELI